MVNDPTQSIQLKKNGEICIVTIYGATKCDTGKPYSKVKFQTEQQSAFQQTLIYNGKVGNKINIGYREFQGDWQELPSQMKSNMTFLNQKPYAIKVLF